jgi:UDP-N-acetylmuramoylalanine--D-glutamate ligase
MLPEYDSHLQGLHNQENIAAAVTVARSFGVGDAALKRGLATFQPLPHRLQAVGTYRGIHFVDDAISTTPESTIAALRALPTTETVFLGGTDRGYDFRELEAFLKRTQVKNIVLFPDTGRRILRSTERYRILHTKRMRDAVAFAYRYTSPKALCLLSCASPSYSVWENFEVKGNEFQYWVRQLGKGKLKSV